VSASCVSMSTQKLAEEVIFKVAREIRSADTQLAYLDQVCAEDALLRGRILSLLRSEEEAPDFLESPVVAVALVEDATIERPGAQIGPYKLLVQIGEGGMGLVYMAKQLTPVRRRVALGPMAAAVSPRATASLAAISISASMSCRQTPTRTGSSTART
jgi:eukaryotic-like serine/threonine-protein kinase